MSLENELNKVDVPKHIFTKKELYHLLLKGDSSVDNILIVDFQGYLRLIQLDILDMNNLDFVPVRYKTFLKKSDIIGNGRNILNNLEEIYKTCLQGWLEYLKTKKTITVECACIGKSNEEIKKEIKELYYQFKALA